MMACAALFGLAALGILTPGAVILVLRALRFALKG